MLIRITGGHSGIKEYLEDGQKKDRFFTRDELDNRVILDGNLSVTDTIINSMETNHDRYFHITLSFKEDYISPETLESINQEFKKYFLHSYTKDEINYYAEAHLPKIKSYISAKDNTLVERKPHIHIVIPKINLFTNTSFNPSTPIITKYIDAFQEYINAKYGLESPKDNLRTKLTDTSEMISRYKGDIFTNQGKEQKTAILNLILENNPNSLNELKSLLIKNNYAVKIRNKDNTASCYLNIKTLGDTKGINLKEFVFCDEFLKLSLEDKLAKLNQEHKQNSNDKTHDGYLQPSSSKPVSAIHEKLMQEWKTIKALEHRFIHRTTSKSQRSRYKKLSLADKIDYLQEKYNTYYQQYNKFLEGIYNDRDYGPTINDIANISRSNESILNDIKGSATRIRDAKDDYNTNLIRKSIARVSEERYRAHLSNDKANEQHTNKDSYLTELIHQNDEKTKQQTFKNYLHELNATLHADILLELAKKIHGIHPEVYLITKNSSGIDRIKCGDRNLSVVDFCTKELNISFKETLQLLENAYNMQNELQQANILDAKYDLYLKDKYQQWFKQYKTNRAEKLKECASKTKITRETIIAEVRNEIKVLRENQRLPYFKRTQQINILKANQIIELKALTEAKLREQKQIREIFNLEMHGAYRNFLTEQANLGDEIALKELRRLKTKFDKNQNNSQNSFNYVDYYKEFRLNITHIIDNNGNICYMLDNNLIIKDTGRKIEVIHNTTDNVKLTLELALAKFGRNIELSGTKEFRQKVVDLAIKDKRNVNFLDEFSKQYYNSCLEQMRNNHIKKSNHNNINTDKER